MHFESVSMLYVLKFLINFVYSLKFRHTFIFAHIHFMEINVFEIRGVVKHYFFTHISYVFRNVFVSFLLISYLPSESSKPTIDINALVAVINEISSERKAIRAIAWAYKINKLKLSRYILIYIHQPLLIKRWLRFFRRSGAILVGKRFLLSFLLRFFCRTSALSKKKNWNNFWKQGKFSMDRAWFS